MTRKRRQHKPVWRNLKARKHVFQRRVSRLKALKRGMFFRGV